MKNLLNSNSSIIFICNLIISVINFSITIVLIRILGQNEFGEFTIISNFIILLQVFIGLKTGEAILNFMNKDLDNIQNLLILKQIIIIDILINFLLFILILIIGYIYSFYTTITYKLLVIYSFTIITSIGFNIFENIYLINDHIVKFYKLKLYSTILHLLIIISFGLKWNIDGVIIGFVISYAIRNILYFFDTKETIIKSFKVNNFIFKLNLKMYINFFKHSYLSTTFKSGSQGLDIIILSTTVSNEKIALYEAAKKFAQIPGLILGSIWSSKSNKILTLGKNKNFKDLYKLIVSMYLKFIPLGIVLILLFILTGEKIIILIFGNNYIDSYMISLIFFSLFWLSYTIGGFARIYFISINKMKLLTILNSFIFFGVIIFGYIFAKNDILMMSIIISLIFLLNALILFMHILLNKKANIV